MQTLMLPAGCAAVSPLQLKNRIYFHSLPDFRVSLISRNVFENRLHHFVFGSSVSESICVSDPLLKKLTMKRCFAMASSDDFASRETDMAKLAQVARRLEKTARSFRRLGNLGFWGQLVCTLVSAVILSFSVVVTGKATSPATFYATASGIAAAFISVFWSFGYIRLSERLKKTANDPSKAPPRADFWLLGAAIVGLLATVGFLVAKALTFSTNPYYQGISPGYSPVLALDVFLVQASANTILSHFLGLIFSLELLRLVTLPTPGNVPVTKYS